MRRATDVLTRADDLREGLGYTLKRRLLGPPMVNEQLGEQRLSNVLALGVLAPDGISSSAYGTEEILIELLKGGLFITAFTLILPLTGVVLFVMALVVLSYREVVSVYTRAGGSYVVARDNFGPRVAQVAAVALLIDYVVTVAVQVAAGTAAVASAFQSSIPQLSKPDVLTIISIIIVLLMCFGNLRGIREAGKSFAVPTYLFSAVMILVIIVGLAKEAFGDLGRRPFPVPGQYGYHGAHNYSSLITFGLVFVLLRAFANGGSSLTGIEAVSNAVSAFRPPEGINARKVLVTEGLILGTLVAGISWLAHATHAAPYVDGVPTVISQEARVVFGQTAFGSVMFYLVQAATALILYTGGNTSFNGFPFLANFVAEDAFLPRWLTKRGHRLVFSNGIIVLTVLSCALMAAVGANVNKLVPFYAIGVFTAFTLAGFGMARYHHTHREAHWRRKLVINFSAGVTSLVVVLIFVVVKFTEGAWLVVILFIVGVPALIRLNREYRLESQVLERIADRPRPPEPAKYTRRIVYVLVDSFDLATIAALRYARSLRPTTLRAVHFVIDTQQADQLREDWSRTDRGVVLDFVDCPDRRVTRCAAELASAEACQPGTHVTVVLPRRSYTALLGRLLHDRTADKIAGVVSQIPNTTATIVPFDVRSRIEVLHEHQLAAQAEKAAALASATASTKKSLADLAAEAAGRSPAPHTPPVTTPSAGTPPASARAASTTVGADGSGGTAPNGDPAAPQPPVTAAPPAGLRGRLRSRRPRPGAPGRPPVPVPPGGDNPRYNRPAPSAGVNPIGSLRGPGRAIVEGRVRAVEIRPVEKNSVLAAEIVDSTGDLTALFYGRSHIPGIICGARVRFRGPVGMQDGRPVMINPAYELLFPGMSAPEDTPGGDGGDRPGT
ncbi:MAG TPA: amino acid permease [Streptosporangiaceae bacterium]|nr:amino acid permease [Streptosporangiaceae bacterium]